MDMHFLIELSLSSREMNNEGSSISAGIYSRVNEKKDNPPPTLCEVRSASVVFYSAEEKLGLEKRAESICSVCYEQKLSILPEIQIYT